MKRQLGLAAVLLAAVAALLVDPSPGRTQAPTKVRITMPVVALSMTPVYLAQARGYFAEEGLD
ncbi:MAG: ABC transporter substrate-binding protein, partial [Candidatus Rokubacteria bacterium]|nr:ABC transporter substrate-binding protein [Candidatus Rokubacteria bacterium]